MPETVAGNLILFNKGPLMGDAEMRCEEKKPACLTLKRCPQHPDMYPGLEMQRLQSSHGKSQTPRACKETGLGEKHQDLRV